LKARIDMQRYPVLVVILIICWVSLAGAADLLEVTVDSKEDARILRQSGSEGVVRLSSGYLILADDMQQSLIRNAGIKATMIYEDVRKDELAIDMRFDEENTKRYNLIYNGNGTRLYRVNWEELQRLGRPAGLAPILIDRMEFSFTEPVKSTLKSEMFVPNYDSIVNLVSRDSIESYLYTLENFNGRVSGTPSNTASAEWIKSKFEDFGYSDVYFDYFTSTIDGQPTSCRNVVAVKTGSTYPGKQVVVGAHFDAVWGSPGADDNGTGTVGVLELARVFADMENELTMVFITFDAEEWGLYGSWHYANEADDRRDSIVAMFNMDMIGDHLNWNNATIYYNQTDFYAQTWDNLANQYVGINAYLAGYLGGSSDHHPFQQHGYRTIFLQEYYFSDCWHESCDHTGNITFDYLTKMIKGMAALVAFMNSDDRDSDGILNLADNCPDDYNPGQGDSDGDGVGDPCDNCPDVYNPEQYDENMDGEGDQCDGEMHIVSYDPPDGYVGVPYYYELEAIGGVEPYYWTRLLGQPPTGCLFYGDTVGVISGTPTWPTEFFLSIELADSDSPSKKDTLGVFITIHEEQQPDYICGDVDDSESVDIDDAVFLISYIFGGGESPDPLESGNVNCESSVDIDDVVYLVTYIFSSGPPPCDC
jgi:hypothetical protein